jgi:hypothetical protein
MSRQRPAARPRCVLADGEVAGGDGPAWHELRDLGNSLGGEVHDGRQWITTSYGEVRRPWRHVAVPGEGPANRGIERTQEHQEEMGSRSEYLDGLEVKRKGLSTVRSCSGGSGERWLGVEAILAKEGRGLDRIRLGGWNLGGVKWLLRIPARSTGGLQWRKEEEEETCEGRWGSGRLYRASTAQLMGEREGEIERGRSWAELKTAGGAGVPSGAWQPLVSGGAMWHGEGRTAEAAWAVGKGVGRCVEGRRRAAGRRTWPGRGSGVQQRRSRGDRDWGRRRGPSC